MPDNVRREARLQRAVTAYIVTGLFFMLLPGTFLGVWNLVTVSNRRALESLSPAWVQAHGHAQVFGWIGTFVLGIGAYSLSKMGRLPAAAVWRSWLCYWLWTGGVSLRWVANITAWQWRVLLPVSALLEMAGFLVFFATVSGHKPAADSGAKPMEAWMKLVLGSTAGFLLVLVLNTAAAFDSAIRGTGPAIAHAIDQRLLVAPAWGFLAPMVWGFNARWLPVFLGLRPPRGGRLMAAFATSWVGVGAALLGHPKIASALLAAAGALAASGMRIFERGAAPAKTAGVHSSFPFFIRLTYVWLAIAACLTACAAFWDHSGGIWGASRHALTVGFVAAMVFGIGQRVLPAFCGARTLFSPRLMFASLALLNVGCALRVASEIPAYEGYASVAWKVLPVSAGIELTAVVLFAANLLISLARPPAHTRREALLGTVVGQNGGIRILADGTWRAS